MKSNVDVLVVYKNLHDLLIHLYNVGLNYPYETNKALNSK